MLNNSKTRDRTRLRFKQLGFAQCQFAFGLFLIGFWNSINDTAIDLDRRRASWIRLVSVGHI